MSEPLTSAQALALLDPEREIAPGVEYVCPLTRQDLETLRAFIEAAEMKNARLNAQNALLIDEVVDAERAEEDAKKQFAALQSRITAAVAVTPDGAPAVAEATRDSERWDGMECLTDGDTLICPPENHGGPDGTWLVSLNYDRAITSEYFGPTLRAAIDAALRASSPSGAPNT